MKRIELLLIYLGLAVPLLGHGQKHQLQAKAGYGIVAQPGLYRHMNRDVFSGFGTDASVIPGPTTSAAVGLIYQQERFSIDVGYQLTRLSFQRTMSPRGYTWNSRAIEYSPSYHHDVLIKGFAHFVRSDLFLISLGVGTGLSYYGGEIGAGEEGFHSYSSPLLEEPVYYVYANTSHLLNPINLFVPLTTSLRIQGEVYRGLSVFAELQYWISLGKQLRAENRRYYRDDFDLSEAIIHYRSVSQQTGRKPKADYSSPFTDTRTSMTFGLIYRLASWGDKDRRAPQPLHD